MIFSLFFSLVFQQVTKPSAQIGFIRFVLIPLFEALGQLFPVLEVTMISFYAASSLLVIYHHVAGATLKHRARNK